MNKAATMILVLFLASCVNQRKVQDYLDKNRDFAAGYCADEFPVTETAEERIDSATYHKTVKELMDYADSLYNVSEQKNHAINSLNEYIDGIESSGQYDAQLIADLRKQVDNIKPVDIAALRKSVEAEVRSKVKPCKDSIIRYEVTAKIDVANNRAAKAEKLTESKQQEIDTLKSKVTKKNELIWWLIAAVVILLTWTFRSVIIPGAGKLFTLIGKLFK